MTGKLKRPIAFMAAFAMMLTMLICFPSETFVGFDFGITSSAAEVWNGNAAAEFAGGEGTEANPYQIKNGEQLAYFAQSVNNDSETYDGKFIMLTADIDLGGKSNPFRGIFNGSRKTISNLTVNVQENAGLFAYNSGRIENLYLSGYQCSSDNKCVRTVRFQ